jgi:hypothetical protein
LWAGITSAPVSRVMVDATLMIRVTSTDLLDTGTRGNETLYPTQLHIIHTITMLSGTVNIPQNIFHIQTEYGIYM